MHEMRAIADDVPWCLSVCQSDCHAASLCKKTAGRIEVRFGVEVLGGPKARCISQGSRSPATTGFDSMRPSTNYSGHLLIFFDQKTRTQTYFGSIICLFLQEGCAGLTKTAYLRRVACGA